MRTDLISSVHETHHYKLKKLECLVGSRRKRKPGAANLLREEGLNVIHLPKTIDNDLWGTDMTFGFDSAVTVATNVIDCSRHHGCFPWPGFFIVRSWDIRWDG